MMSSRKSGVAVVVWACTALCALAIGASSAAAIEFGGGGEGAGQLDEPHGVAVEQATGAIYISDFGNNRIDEFEANGTFVRAWGWGVDKAKPEAKLQECTTATGCVRGEGGSGAGELDRPDGVAFDNVSGEPALYVEDSENRRVQKFSPVGAFVRMFGGDVNKLTGGDVCTSAEASECQRGKEGTGEGEFEHLGRENAIAVGTGGAVYVGDREHVQWFSPEGAREGGFDVGATGNVESLALAPSGDVFLTLSRTDESFNDGNLTPEVREYTSAGKLEHTIALEGEETGNGSVFLASDGSGHLFVDEYFNQKHGTEGWPAQILEYDEALGEIEVIPAPKIGGSYPQQGGLALFEMSGRVSQIVTAGGRTGLVAVVPAPAPGPVVASEEATPGATPEAGPSATLKAALNPEGKQTKYHFDYGTEVTNETASPTLTLKAEGFTAEAIELKIAKLKPSTTYHFHVVAENSEGRVESGDVEFETLPAVAVDGISVSDVTAESATLEALVDPTGSDTEYHFEYAAAGEAERVTDGVDAGAGAVDVPVSAHVQGLRPGTVYVFRVVAENALGEAQREGQLTTQAVGGGSVLLDDRQWELVSPPDKHGALLSPIEAEAVTQASVSGDAMTYLTASTATEAEPQGVAGGEQVLSVRGADGWSSKDIGIHHETFAFSARNAGEYAFFSEDLSAALLEPEPESAGAKLERCSANGCVPEAFPEATEYTPYIRHDATCEADVASCFEPLLTDAAGYADVPAGSKFGAELGRGVLGTTPDLQHAVLRTQVPLTAVPTNGHEQLYEWSADKPPAERLQLVSVLPESEGGGAVSSEDEQPLLGGDMEGFPTASGWRPISRDGSRIFWTEGQLGLGFTHRLYMRDMVKGETIRLDVPQPGAPSGGGSDAVFQAASADGSRVFFVDDQRLTAQSSQSGADLYECRIVEEGGRDVCKLTDLTPETDGEPAGIIGTYLPGTSEDGSYVYFAANGALARGASGGHCEGDENVHVLPSTLTCNLYVSHEGKTTFIAALSAEDGNDWGGFDRVFHSVGHLTARVSPNGRYIAFMSSRPLTGYDNRDAVTGRPDEEVYLYDAVTGKLTCASCDPTGARPLGVEVSEFSAGFSDGSHTENLADVMHPGFGAYEKETEIAANVPGGDVIEGYDGAVYQPRYLSNGGRLFFNSVDALVPQDVNGQEDVYEYEPPGAGSCTVSSSTYSERDGGCVDLISSGTSAHESGFLDASEIGGDVFFLTAERLVPEDHDSALDVYDAHECTASVPCFPEPAVTAPPCESGDACKGAPNPQPVVFGAPPSATFEGQGNPAAQPGVREAGQPRKAGRPVRKQKARRHKLRGHSRPGRRRGRGVRRNGNRRAGR